jgi:hypothetical protein
MYLDIFKHMMTFSSGGILLVPTVAHALFPEGVQYRVLLWVSIIIFVQGLFVSTVGVTWIPRNIQAIERINLFTTSWFIDPHFLQIQKGYQERGEEVPAAWQAWVEEGARERVFSLSRQRWTKGLIFVGSCTFTAMGAFVLFVFFNFSYGST